MLSTALFYNLNQISEEDKNEAGNISSDLIKLADYGIAIPNAFVLTTNGTKKYFDELKLEELYKKEMSSKWVESPDSFKKASIAIQKKILEGNFAPEMQKQLSRFYSNLSGFNDAYVSIKVANPASVLGTRLKGYDFITLTNIKGVGSLSDAIKKVLAHIFKSEYLYYLHKQKLTPFEINLPILIQKMVQPEVSGNLYTINPYDDNEKQILVEAILGLYDPIIENQLTPDHYIIDLETQKAIQKYIVPQEWMLIRKGNAEGNENPNFKVNISKQWQHKQKLDDKYFVQMVKIKKILDKAFSAKNLYALWYFESGRIWIYTIVELAKLEITDKTDLIAEVKVTQNVDVKTEPLKEKTSTIEEKKQKIEIPKPVINEEVKEVKEAKDNPEKQIIDFNDKKYEILLLGKNAVNGNFIGEVKIVVNEDDLNTLNKSMIAVIDEISSKYVHYLKNAGAIVIDQKDELNDVILLANDYKIPCIIGTSIASKILRQGEKIAIDADQGKIYEIKSVKLDENVSKEVKKQDVKEELSQSNAVKEVMKDNNSETVMKLGKSIESIDADELLSIKKEIKDVDKKTEEIKKIPIKDADLKKVEEKYKYPYITTATSIMLSVLDPASITLDDVINTDGIGLYRSEYILTNYGTDLKTNINNEQIRTKIIQDLKGSLTKLTQAFNPKPVIYRFSDFKLNETDYSRDEVNPIIGNRGAYMLLQYPELLEVQLEAIRQTRNIDDMKNLWVNIPFARSVDEVKEIKQKIQDFGFKRSSTFKIYVTIETPSLYLNITELLELGIDGVIVDSNDLTQLLLGSGYTSKSFSNYDQLNSGIFNVIEEVANKSIKYKTPLIVTGKLFEEGLDESIYTKLLNLGVTSLSVSKNSFDKVKLLVSKAETQQLLRQTSQKSKLKMPKRKLKK